MDVIALASVVSSATVAALTLTGQLAEQFLGPLVSLLGEFHGLTDTGEVRAVCGLSGPDLSCM
jgi:hypothetical protein